MHTHIRIRKAKLHNLKGIDVDIPRGKLTVATGVSGSGKSTLVFDILFEEGRKRYQQAMGYRPRLEAEDMFDEITGLVPTIAVEQRTLRLTNPRSVVGTKTKLLDLLRRLYSLAGTLDCRECGTPVDQSLLCSGCGTQHDRLHHAAFSFNSPQGMCLRCFGRGYITELQTDRLINDPSLPLPNALSAIVARKLIRGALSRLVEVYGFSPDTPFAELPVDVKDAVFHGSRECGFDGVATEIYRLMRARPKTQTERNNKHRMEHWWCARVQCPACQGYRLHDDALAVTVAGRHIGHLGRMSVRQLADFLDDVEHHSALADACGRIVRAIGEHLRRIADVGLSHLTLDRPLPSLSGGEQTRLFFVAHMDCELDSVAYIFDEPTVGLHELEKQALISTIKQLTAGGQTVIVVEHDRNVIAAADHVIDLGPGGGREGGEVVFSGAYQDLLRIPESITGQYLSGCKRLPGKRADQYRQVPSTGRALTVRRAGRNNLKDLTVRLPLGAMIGVAGVSGSGKSSLITQTLVPLLRRHLATEDFEDDTAGHAFPADLSGDVGELDGWQDLQRCLVVSQAPIGRNRKSVLVTYVGIWDRIRSFFARLPQSVELGLAPGHFSFNSDKGGCPECEGEGTWHLALGMGVSAPVACPRCAGKRYREEVLSVQHNDKSIYDVLQTSVVDALDLFNGSKPITRVLDTLQQVGLGYATLGQPSVSLSGGEAQRVKLARELGRVKKGGTLYVLDEPTTGLSYADTAPLMLLLDKLVARGNSVIVIEHDPAFLSFCDWLVELGPDGGDAGGEVIATGSPPELRDNSCSRIGPFLTMTC